MNKMLTTVILAAVIPVAAWAFHVVSTLSKHDVKIIESDYKFERIMNKLDNIENYIRER